MLDRDLAVLYGVETRRLNEQVKRNIERFPEDFMFQLTEEECSKSQFATLNEGRGHNIKKLPYAFTEQGVAMLSGVLKSPTAVEVNSVLCEHLFPCTILWRVMRLSSYDWKQSSSISWSLISRKQVFLSIKKCKIVV